MSYVPLQISCRFPLTVQIYGRDVEVPHSQTNSIKLFVYFTSVVASCSLC